MVVSNHYLKKYSCKPIQTYWVSLQKWSAFWPHWSNFVPLVATEMTENGGFWPLSEKVFMQSNSNLVSTLIVWVLRIVVSDYYMEKYSCSAIQTWCVLLLDECSEMICFLVTLATYWVSVENWFTFAPCRPNFGPLVATKWLEIVVSDHYLEKYPRNPIQTWCVHFLGECWELIRFWARLPNFGPLMAKKWLKMVVSH